MCRYAAYLGPPLLLSELVYKPANSLVHQATDATFSPTRINADGFGVGWYSPEIRPEPAVFKDISPVWSNRNLGEIADNIVSPAIVAHVRSAKSFDPVSRENCHPVRRGRLLWMHNGDIPGRARLTRQVGLLANDALLAQIRGNTDTELAFTLFLTHLNSPLEENLSLEELASAMKQTVSQISAWHREAADDRPLELNFCVISGTVLVAIRFAISKKPGPTLYWCEDNTGSESSFVVVASEPLSDKDSWREIDNGEMLLVSSDLTVGRERLSL